MIDKVILVDNNDREIGQMEKIEAHKKGLLHRAFSVFIFNSLGDILLQKRASGKYHSPNLWTNACCSHPMPGESPLQGAQRRLQQEMGFACELEYAFNFQYKSVYDNGLTEHEFDHVFTGIYEGKVNPNPQEVDNFKYVSIESLNDEIQKHPENFTTWFRLLYFPLIEHYKSTVHSKH